MAVLIQKKKIEPVQVYRFGKQNQGNASMKTILGGKGANLAEMGSLGIRVPDGFTLPCQLSVQYSTLTSSGGGTKALLNNILASVDEQLLYLKDIYGYMPLVSVRSGAMVSMPGMMDTILNVGITNSTLQEWADRIGVRTALDSYRRLIQMYGSVALDIPMTVFTEILEQAKLSTGVASDSQLGEDDLHRLVIAYLTAISNAGKEFPQTVEEQIKGAVLAVFSSWDNPRAVEYRNIHGISHDCGTAVNIQTMVYGNYNDNSATGVLFTRNPSTGEKSVTGEYLVNAQGEDVVSGIRTPEPLADLAEWNPKVYTELISTVTKLEQHYKDMQDVEFTVQDGELFILQTRTGKRSAHSAFKVAHDMALETLITKPEAVLRVTTEQLIATLSDVIDPTYVTPPLFKGIAAGGGLVTGVAVFSSEKAVQSIVDCILITPETNPDDIGGMNASVGILTATGGLTSHAAVVARGMNKSCVVGATMLKVQNDYFSYGDEAETKIYAGSVITIDGSTGNVYQGTIPVIAGGLSGEAKAILGWATKDTPTKIDLDMNNIETGVLGIPARYLSLTTALITTDIATNMTALGKLLETNTAEAITVDLTGAHTIQDPEDRMMGFMFGEPVSTGDSKPCATMLDKAYTLTSSWEPALKSRVTLQATGLAKEHLELKGWSICGELKTVADLYTTRVLSTDAETISKLFGTHEVFESIKKLISSHKNTTILDFSSPAHWFELLTKKGQN